jgi:hypothetical protein
MARIIVGKVIPLRASGSMSRSHKTTFELGMENKAKDHLIGRIKL